MNYDNFDFSPYLIVNYVKRPLMPPQLLSTQSIEGRPGAYFFEKKHEPIIIPVGITLVEGTLTGYFERKRFLAGHLNKKSPKKLVFANEPNMFIEGILEGSTDLDEIASIGKGVLNFFCPDPYYYALEDEVFTFVGSGAFNFTRVKGNEESEPVIEITGTNQGGAITITTDNTEMVFDGMLNEGELLVLDSKLMTSFIVEKDGAKRSANNDLNTMDFPIFQVGANQIHISVEGSAVVEETKIYAKSKWI